jgi:HK97 gp10 family phage protein
MSFGFEVGGLAQHQDELQRLSKAGKRKALRQATMAGARVGAKAIKAAAPVDEGELRDNVVAAAAKQNEEGTFTAGVRVRGGKGRYANNARNRRAGRAGQYYETAGPAYYWRFSELGTSKEPARPWIRPTWDSEEDAISDAVRDRLASAIDEALVRR